jgi:hypothetical protein
MLRIPLEVLKIEPMASGRRSLRLTRDVSWEAFPAYAESLVRALRGSIVDRADSAAERVWSVTIGDNPYWLSFDDFGLGVSLDSRDDEADGAIEGIRTRLLEMHARGDHGTVPSTTPSLGRRSMRFAASVLVALLKRAGWAPIATFLLHAFLSRVLDAYTRFPPLDIPMHLLGGVAIAYFFSSSFRALPDGVVSGDARWLAESLCVASLTATASVFWEFAEFTSDRLFSTGAQKGLEDTILDMALGILGGVLYLFIAGRLGSLGGVRPLPQESILQ